jgi:hypothetical protein
MKHIWRRLFLPTKLERPKVPLENYIILPRSDYIY